MKPTTSIPEVPAIASRSSAKRVCAAGWNAEWHQELKSNKNSEIKKSGLKGVLPVRPEVLMASGPVLVGEWFILNPRQAGWKKKLPASTWPQLVIPGRNASERPFNAVNPGRAINIGITG